MSRSIQENEAILKQFRDWLTQTAEEVSALEDAAAPRNFTTCVLSPTAWTEQVTQFNETVTFDGALEASPSQPPPPPTDFSEPETEETNSQREGNLERLPEVGLRQLVEAFTAMRHESKLQTKSSRGLVDTVQSSLASLDASMHQLQAAAQSQEAQHQRTEARWAQEKKSAQWSADEVALPWIEALIELDEALLRGAQTFEGTSQQQAETLDAQLQELPWWQRWTVGLWHRQLRQQCLEAMEKRHAENFAHMKEGSALIRKRFQRVLHEHEVHRIECVGCPVDPETMNVVELVHSSGVEPETVVELVRPGYKWRDKVIRYAEVRAAGARNASKFKLKTHCT